MDHAIRSGCSGAQTLQIFERAVMHLGPCCRESLGTDIRASQYKNLMSSIDQLSDHRGTYKTCCASDEYSHIKTPFLVYRLSLDPPALQPGCGAVKPVD